MDGKQLKNTPVDPIGPIQRGNGSTGRNGQAKAPAPETAITPMAFVWSLDRTSDVGRALLAASRRLREAGVETPQLDSAVLMAHVLGVSKAWLYAHPTRRLSEEEISRYENLVRRRMAHEPVGYLVGYRSFYGLDITVDRNVLIPRPETELLVERVIQHATTIQEQGQTVKIADIGTGSGAIAVALAVNLPESRIWAVDVSDAALAVAAQNVWRYGVGEQVQLLPGHLLEPLPEAVDIIVANLPYIATPDVAGLPEQIRDYEPLVALDGGADGLRIVRAFFEMVTAPCAFDRLRPDGRIFLEIGAGQGEAARALAQLACPAARVEVWMDYAGLDRIVVVAT